MRAIIKLIFAALVIHATFRTGTAYLRYYQFKDAVHQVSQFSGQRPESEIHERVVDLAREHEIPLDARNVRVRRADNHTLIDARYREHIEILPTYRYPWDFVVEVDTFTIVPKEAR